MREKEPDINHQCDVWHFVKNIKKQVINVGWQINKGIKVISEVKSIGNNLWWACVTSEGDVELLAEKWISILFHIQNNHEWTSHNKFTKCANQKLKKQIKAKEWISPKSYVWSSPIHCNLQKCGDVGNSWLDDKLP